VVRPIEPDRVDLDQPAKKRRETEDDEEEPAGLRRIDRQERSADDVPVGLTRSRILRVLLVEDEQQVDGDQGDHQRGDQKYVDGEQPRDEELPRELTPEEEERSICADEGDTEQYAL
jgi:hypothetical protein